MDDNGTPPVADTGGATPPPVPTAQAPVSPPTASPSPAPAPTQAAEVTTPPSTPNPDAYKIPDAYKEQPWASKIKSEEDLWKQLDNTQKLIGKKTIVPDFTKATPEEIEQYYAQTRPASVDAYQFNEGTDPTIKTVLGESLLKNGISAQQANAVIKQYQDVEKTQVAEAYNPEKFAAEIDKQFGQEKFDPRPINAMLKANLAPEVFDKVNALPNAALAVLYKATTDLKAKLIKEYGIVETGAHVDAERGNPQLPDIAKVREGIRSEITALSSRMHSAEDKQVLIDKLNATYQTK